MEPAYSKVGYSHQLKYRIKDKLPKSYGLFGSYPSYIQRNTSLREKVREKRGEERDPKELKFKPDGRMHAHINYRGKE